MNYQKLALIALILVPLNAYATPAECIQYDAGSKTILISCEASFQDIVNSPSIVQAPGGNTVIQSVNGSYMLDGNLFVDDTGILDISSISLKIVGEHSIDVEEGTIFISNSNISSWNATSNTEVKENSSATIPRAWILVDDSPVGGYIRNSTISHLGYETDENGRGGIQLDDVSDFEISNSKFHDNYFAFYSNTVDNVKIFGNEYYDNLLYALDPHTGSRDMQITNNKVYDNAGFGIICSLNCSDVTIANNDVYRNHRAGIMLSRNTTDSLVINNTVRDHPNTYGIFVSQSSNNTVTNNTVKDDNYGIYVKESNSINNVITNNNITGSKRAIVFSNVTGDNVVANNTISKNTSYEYFASKASKLTLDGQKFDKSEIRGAEGENIITIKNSGIIRVDGNMTDTISKPYVTTLTNTTIEIN